MKILVLNPIMYTPHRNIIPKVRSIKDTMMYNMCLGFKQNNHHITLAVAEEYKPTEIEKYDFEVLFFKSNFTSLFLPSVIPFSIDLFFYLKKKQSTFDIIISSEVFSFQSLFASLLCPTKTIIWHEMAIHQRKMKKLPSKIWYNIIAPLFERKSYVIPRSKPAYKFIHKYLKNVSSTPIEHGINLEQFKFQEEKKKQFIVVSQLIPRKNIESIIKKFNLFLKKYDSNYKLLIVGKGELHDKLAQMIKELHLENNIFLLGFKNHTELNLLLAESKGLLIDTFQDNNMVSIPESIVCGTPIITNLIPTNSYFIQDHKLGIVKEWNENDLQEVATNNLYVKNCINIRETLSNHYLCNKMINIWNNHINKK